MWFNSLEFAVFLPITFFIYWIVFKNRVRAQNAFIVVASYFFYGWWDWRFLSLIAFSSLLDYAIGIGLSTISDEPKRKALLLASLCTNTSLLGFFKYFNFFSESFANAFTFLGYPLLHGRSLEIVLPIGISFYTFQTLSYSIDVYKKKIEATTDIVAFFAFVSYFPQLVAGPIERASHLLPQFQKTRTFDYSNAVDGMRQILWGLFKKVVVADNCSLLVNTIFANYSEHSSSTLFLGLLLFSFQIYGDFSGYSDIAIGTSKLFGFSLMQNFAMPYFSRDIAEFWRRWHISLSTWFRDYIYIPLGGSRGNTITTFRNIFVVFLISGLWHGANWTFVAWGFLHACGFLPYVLLQKNRRFTDNVAPGKLFPNFRDSLKITATFVAVSLTWVFFRSKTLTDAFAYLKCMTTWSLFSWPDIDLQAELLFVPILVIIEWFRRENAPSLNIGSLSIQRIFRWILYYLLIFTIIKCGAGQQEFIYFQF